MDIFLHEARHRIDKDDILNKIDALKDPCIIRSFCF